VSTTPKLFFNTTKKIPANCQNIGNQEALIIHL
jgi:hypothetical protein